jgi:hypothetical protein
MARHHAKAEERSLALHRVVAERLKESPELVERARELLEQWALEGKIAQPYEEAWRAILVRAADEIAEALVDAGEHGRALRQASPFAGALDPRVRWRILKELGQSKGGS